MWTQPRAVFSEKSQRDVRIPVSQVKKLRSLATAHHGQGWSLNPTGRVVFTPSCSAPRPSQARQGQA